MKQVTIKVGSWRHKLISSIATSSAMQNMSYGKYIYALGLGIMAVVVTMGIIVMDLLIMCAMIVGTFNGKFSYPHIVAGILVVFALTLFSYELLKLFNIRVRIKFVADYFNRKVEFVETRKE